MFKVLLLIFIIRHVSGHNVSIYDNLEPTLHTVNGVLKSIRRIPIFQDVSIKRAIELVDSVADEFFPPPPLPEVDEHKWWGEGRPQYQDTSIRPYRTEFRPERIHRLLQKLSDRDNFTRPLFKAAFSYGMNSNFLDKLLDYWEHQYNFKERESRLNSYPQYKTNIQGLDIHYYHIKQRTTKKVVPLLLLHGWPVSNMEYLYVIPGLLEDREEYDYVFDIVAPTIPGFGYSKGASKKGLNSYQTAIIFKNLMYRLEYKQFYIHGGDFGQYIAADMMTLYQDQVLGLHTNFPYSFRPKTLVKYLVGSIYPPAVVDKNYEDRLYPVLKYAYYVLRNSGYFHIQATKPDTLGIALQDSPSGLASWILTAMSWSSNPDFDNFKDGGLPETFNIDDLLDVLTIMWDSESITTSIRMYAEISAIFQDPKSLAVLITPTKVPYACIKFLHEIIYQPDSFIKDKYPNLVQSTIVDFGGHFAALENPYVLTNDIWEGIDRMIEFNQRKPKEVSKNVKTKSSTRRDKRLGNRIVANESKDKRVLSEEYHRGFNISNIERIFEENLKYIVSTFKKHAEGGKEETIDEE